MRVRCPRPDAPFAVRRSSATEVGRACWRHRSQPAELQAYCTFNTACRCKRQEGWTVNPSANAYTGSNPARDPEPDQEDVDQPPQGGCQVASESTGTWRPTTPLSASVWRACSDSRPSRSPRAPASRRRTPCGPPHAGQRPRRGWAGRRGQGHHGRRAPLLTGLPASEHWRPGGSNSWPTSRPPTFEPDSSGLRGGPGRRPDGRPPSRSARHRRPRTPGDRSGPPRSHVSDGSSA